jgi:hypothetical protein
VYTVDRIVIMALESGTMKYHTWDDGVWRFRWEDNVQVLKMDFLEG